MNTLEKVYIQIENNRNAVGYDTVDWPIGYIKNQFDLGVLYIPAYQRNFVWSSKIKSKFVESILMGLPIPFLFLYRNKSTGNLEIVDGAQRIQTLVEFLNNKLKLEELKRLTTLNTKLYSDLPEKFRNIFETTSLRIIILDEKTTENNRKEIFNRLNTTGERLEDIEVILGSYTGEFIEFLKECSNNSDFKELCPIPEDKLNRKENIELIARFFAYSDDLEIDKNNKISLKKYSNSVAPFIEEFIKKMVSLENNFSKEFLKENFIKTLKFVKEFFPYGFKKSKTAKSTPRNRFEAISLGVYLALKQKNNLKGDKEYIKNWIESKEFKKVTTSDGANNKNKLISRIEFVTKKLLED